MRVPHSLSSIPRQWRTPKVVVGLFVLELPFTIAALALFGIAQPDLYRTRFWQEGADHGWNSNPNELIYAIANYKPIKTPLPWSQFTTDFNVVISVLSVFILLCKSIMFITTVFHPLLSLTVHSALVALYAVSVHNQAGPDTTDPAHPQSGAPWYITKSCGPPISSDLIGYCKQAKAAFAVTIILLALFTVQVILALVTLWPNKQFRSARISDKESGQAPWEMLDAPRTPGTAGGLKSPTTPRTTAFNTLSGNGKAPVRQGNQGIPLRHHIGMGEETYQGPSRR